jgi:hypothetical protein
MYQLVDAQHVLLDQWNDAFRSLAERWADEDVSWDDVRPGFAEAMKQAPGPDASQVDQLLSWLDTSVSEGDRRMLIGESEREPLFRRLLSGSNESLSDLFAVLYQPVEGDLYWNDQESMIFQQGEWRDNGAADSGEGETDEATVLEQGWSSDSDQAARLGVPYWDGAEYLTYRDGAWHPSDEGDAPADQGALADSSQAEQVALAKQGEQAKQDEQIAGERGADAPAEMAPEVAAILKDSGVQAARANLTSQVERTMGKMLEQEPGLAQVPAEQLQEWISAGLEQLFQEAQSSVS